MKFTKVGFWLKPSTVFAIYFIGINAISLQSYLGHHLNVWDIFRQSTYHLFEGKDLYNFYPEEYNDSFLYSPSFAMLFAPFAKLPYLVGYFLWNNIAMMIIPFILYKMKKIDDKQKAIICYIALIEMLTCLQGTQSNTIICALLLIAFVSMENNNQWMAAFAIAIGFYIKIFPVLALSMVFFYPGKLKFLGKSAVAFITIGLLPLLVCTPGALISDYERWGSILIKDQHDNFGTSLIGLIGANFGITDASKILVQLIGIGCFSFVFIRQRMFRFYYYRLYFLCSLLVWVVLFNHAAEIYSYAIAIIGIALWTTTQPSLKKYSGLIICLIIVASILPIDPTPKVISDVMQDYNLKVIPFLIIYFMLMRQILVKDESFFKNPMVAENYPQVSERKIVLQAIRVIE